MSIGFTPYPGMVALAVPNDALKSEVILNDKDKELRTEEYIKKGNPLIVATVGEGVTFVSPEDRVLVAGHARLQKVETDVQEDPFFLVRESDILVRLDA